MLDLRLGDRLYIKEETVWIIPGGKPPGMFFFLQNDPPLLFSAKGDLFILISDRCTDKKQAANA